MKIKQVIEELKTETDNTLNSMVKEDIKKIIDYLLNKYHNENMSLVSDQLFDYIKEFYENKFKIIIKEVGFTINDSKKVKLPYYMGSLDKIKSSSTVFNKWINNYPGPYVCSYKLDGISALLCKINGKIFMYTRGNGIEGQDISYCIDKIGINLKKMIEGDAIRGELIMSKNNFKTIADKMANARNAVSGIINTKKPDAKMLSLIDFVPYWVLSPQLKISEQLKYIEKKDFTPKSVYYELFDKISLNNLSEKLIDGRKNYKYEIDGIVIIDDSKIYSQEVGSNPSYGFAFKQLLTDQIAESTVVDVIWEVSKDKYIKPKIKINTVELLGSEITFATAFNAKYIVDNNIGPGAIVKIVKSGDVIPYIQEIIKPSETLKPKMPNIKYIWNDTKVDIIADELDEDTMNKIIIKKLAYFFSTLDISFMGEGTIQKFVLNGYNDLWKILSAEKKDLEKIDGFGNTIIEKIYQSIKNGLSNRKLCEIMAASQIFGRGIGIRKFKLITDDYPNIIEIYKKNGKEETKKLINNISGFENKTTNKIVDNFDDFIIYLNKFILAKPNLLESSNKKVIKNKEKNIDIIEENTKSKLSKYSGKTIVFTGFRDKEIENELEKVGSKITTSVSKNTNIIIAANPNEDSSKIIKGKELDIEIISKDEFYKSITK